MYLSQVSLACMASNNDGFATAFYEIQNLSLIKFEYLVIKIIILPFSYFLKHKHIEARRELLNFFVAYKI